ncbi:putative RNA polymerase II subunit B1 CTD phosphatase RPAP2 [Saccostrea cucullata]|uniref:putative RNA polymerase II subunit B1 CTD phosphatase RPAP2 n=1 Tax=Saccostrea cuccullata TaxID=36930 RepID=UPI002ED1ED29
MDKKSLEAKIRYQVACEEKAHRIVEQLIEPGISENVLTEAGLYITPDHYQDITEERSISRLCGYPICDNRITKVLSQKYHISTKTNKVYDITDRKNFCSNECYKASVFFQKQIATSPLWSRKEEKPKLIELLPKELNRGSVGKEVINTHTELYREAKRFRDEEKKLQQKAARERSMAEEQDKTVHDVVAGVEKLNVNDENQSDKKNPVCKVEAKEDKDKHEENSGHQENRTEKQKGSSSDVLSTASENEQSEKINRLMALLDRRKHLLGKLVQDEKAQLPSTTNSEKVSAAEHADVSVAKPCEEDNDDSDDSCDDSEKDSQSDVKNRKTIVQSCDTAISEKVPSGAISQDSENVCVKTKRKENNPSEISYLSMVCELMKEWITLETLRFLDCQDQEFERQAGVTTEMEAKIKDLCRRVDQQEAALDGLIGEQESLEDKLPVRSLAPDYKSLKKETEDFSQRVNSFFAGGKAVTEKEVKSQAPVYLPSVDSHNQLLIRQRIVMDQLNKVIPDLLPPLKLSIQDVFTELKQLVTTFRLTSKNILFKPAEWSLVGLLLLKILSRKNLQVSCAFLNTSAVEYFSIFLGSIGEELEKVDLHVTKMLQKGK